MNVYRKFLLCALTTTLLSTGIAHAAGEYFAAGRAGGARGSAQLPTDSYEITSIGIPAGGDIFVNYDDPGTLGVGASEASIFGLRSSSYSRAGNESFFPSNFDFSFSNATNCYAIWSDFIVTGPAGPSTVPISVNALVEGSFAARIASGSSPTSRVGGGMEFFINTGLQGGFWTRTFGGSYGVFINAGEAPVYVGTGLLRNFDGSTVVTTELFNVPVNTPFAMRFNLITTTTLRTKFGSLFFMEVGVDFSDTAKFPTNGPAFNLPAGYTINSVDAGIVNNAYVAVPEASSMALSFLGAGVFLVCAFARRYSHRVPCSSVSG